MTDNKAKKVIVRFKQGNQERWICGNGSTADNATATIFPSVSAARAHLKFYQIKWTPSFRYEFL